MLSSRGFSSVCRICLGKHNIAPLTSKQIDILKKINFKIDDSDARPQNVCTICASELEIIDKFIEKWYRSQIKLKTIEDMESGTKICSPTVQCPNCKRVFMRSGINQHYRTNPLCLPRDSEERISPCGIDQDGKLCEHPFKCNECSGEFTDEDNLRNHLMNYHSKHVKTEEPAPTSHRKLSLKCEVCQKGFTKKSSLNDHMNSHTGKTPHVCVYCGKGFARSAARTIHVYRFHVQREDISIKQRKYIDKRVHLNFKCKLCGKVLRSRSGYDYHQLLHKRIKTFLCYMCGRKFVTNGALQNHVRSHTGETPFECQDCGKRFRQRNLLRCHMQKHAKEKSLTCPHCCKSFESNKELADHISSHELSECPKCKKSFLKRNIENHVLSHSREKAHKCHICDKKFFAQSHLTVHLRTHSGAKPFSCNVCGKFFGHSQTLKVHMRQHTGEKPFKCLYCEKQFYDSSNFNRHMNRFHKECIADNDQRSEF